MARGYSHPSGLVPIKQRDPSSLRSVGMTTGEICSVGMTTGGICSVGMTTLRLWAVGMTTGRICSVRMTYKHYGTLTLQHSHITTLSHYGTETAQKINRHKKSGPKAASLHCHKRPYQPVISFRPAPMSARLRTVLTPASSSAANFSSAVPLPPETIAPAWPIRLPAGAVTPAI